MNRWGYRFIAILMLLIFALVFHHMYRTLVMLRDQNAPVTST